MQNPIWAVALLYIFIVLFVPSSQHNLNEVDKMRTKQTLNMASKVLVNAIDIESASYEIVSLGFYLQDEDLIKIDQKRLLSEFTKQLQSRFGSQEAVLDMERRIPGLILTYGDRFYVAQRTPVLKPGGDPQKTTDYDINFVWGPPMFYTTVDDLGRPLYVNIRDEQSLTYKVNADTGKEIPVKVENSSVRVNGKRLDKVMRDQIVIDSVNRVVEGLTKDSGNDNPGFHLQISKADFTKLDTSSMSDDQKQQYYSELGHMSNFNVLEGITFFILYANNKDVYVSSDDLSLVNYNAAGFTLVKRY